MTFDEILFSIWSLPVDIIVYDSGVKASATTSNNTYEVEKSLGIEAAR